MTEIRKPKQEKDERRTSNAQHRTLNVGVASLRVFNKIGTPRAYHNSMLDVRFLIRFWSLNIGICDLFGIWCLGFVILDTKLQGRAVEL